MKFVFLFLTLTEIMVCECLESFDIVSDYTFFTSEVTFSFQNSGGRPNTYVAENTLEFRNSSPFSFNIVNVEADPQVCEPVDWTKTAIRPGGKGKIRLKFWNNRPVLGSKSENQLSVRVRSASGHGNTDKTIRFNILREVIKVNNRE